MNKRKSNNNNKSNRKIESAKIIVRAIVCSLAAAVSAESKYEWKKKSFKRNIPKIIIADNKQFSV